jgi:2'-5' RNA ligase
MNHNDEIRAFIAIPLPDNVREFLTNLIGSLKEKFPEKTVKWVYPANIHITLRFLGNVSKPNLNLLIEKLDPKKQLTPFSLTINKIGAFPSIFKPQVIWVGTNDDEHLKELVNFIEESSSIIKNDEPPKSFTSHMTIARLRPGIKKDQIDMIKHEMFKYKDIEPLNFMVDHYCLYQSVLSSRGPVYSELRRYEL